MEALEAITEATTIYGELARLRPDAHQPNLATSLNNQAIQFADLGHIEEALEAITETVGLYQGLCADFPGMYTDALQRSRRLLDKVSTLDDL